MYDKGLVYVAYFELIAGYQILEIVNFTSNHRKEIYKRGLSSLEQVPSHEYDYLHLFSD